MTADQIIVLGNILTLFFLLFAYGTSLFYVKAGGKFYRGVLWGWILSCILMYILSIIGLAFRQSYPEHIDAITSVFPETIIFMPFFIFGWIPALVTSGLGLLIRRWIIKAHRA